MVLFCVSSDQSIRLAVVGLGLPRLPRYVMGWSWVFMGNSAVRYTVVGVYSVLNVALIIFPLINSERYQGTRYPGYYLLITNLIAFAFGGLWWLGLTRGLKRFLGIEAIDGMNDRGERRVRYTVSKIFRSSASNHL